MSNDPLEGRLGELLRTFALLNSVMTIAELETLKAAVFAELGLEVAASENPVENVSPLLLVGDTELEDV